MPPPPNGVTPLCGPLRYVCTVCKSYAVRMRCARDTLRPARPAGAHPARALSSRCLALAAARPSPVERVGQLGSSSSVVPCISSSYLPRRDRIASAVSMAACGRAGMQAEVSKYVCVSYFTGKVGVCGGMEACVEGGQLTSKGPGSPRGRSRQA